MTIRVPYDTHLLVGNALGHAWQRFFDAVASSLNANATLVSTAVQQSRLITVVAGLQGGGDLSQDRFVGLYKFTGAVADLPTTNSRGEWAFATNARNAGEGAGAGTGAPVCWTDGMWRIPGVATAVAS